MKTFAVIGLGRFGSSIAQSIYNKGYEVLAVDRDEKLVNKASDFVTNAVVADARDREVLEKIGIKNCDCVIVAIGSDLGVSAFVTMNLSDIGISEIVCKASDATHREILKKLGATRVVIPEKEFAEKLAGTLTGKNVLDYINISENVGVDEINVPAQWANKRVGEINIRAKYGVNLIAVRNGEKVNADISAETLLEADSKLFIIGTEKALGRFIRKS